MKRSQQVYDSMIADQTKELMASLMSESVEELESTIAARDVEIGALKAKLESALARIEEYKAGEMSGGECMKKCAHLEGQLSTERSERAKTEALLRDRIRKLETDDTAEVEPKGYDIDVIRDGANMTRTLRVRFA